MIAKLENDSLNVYNEENILIGGIKAPSNLKTTEIKIRENKYELSRNKWNTKISKDGKVIYNLKMNSFSGKTEILETGHKITSGFGLKWGTKMVDKENNTLLKIRTKNQIVNTSQYQIERSNTKVTDLEILTTLYGHLHGSNMKLSTLIIGAVAVVIISIGIMS